MKDNGVLKYCYGGICRVGGVIGDEGCSSSLQYPATDTEYFIKVALVDSTFISKDDTVSSTKNSVG